MLLKVSVHLYFIFHQLIPSEVQTSKKSLDVSMTNLSASTLI